MAIPLLWLGAAAVATYAGVKYSDRLGQHSGAVKNYPGETKIPVQPVDGAIVCCEVYGVLDHTGIWVDNHIVELSGTGLVRAISPERFLQERSGNTIYLACGSHLNPLITEGVAERAVADIYAYRPYDVLDNNCHHFVWEIHSQGGQRVGRFGDLNAELFAMHGEQISWHPIK